MPSIADQRRMSLRFAAGIVTLQCAGFALTMLVFYPGYVTIDAGYVYAAITQGLGDWQSPVMSVLWALIDPIAPGSLSMLLLMALLYWGGFGLIAFALARRSGWLGIAVMIFAFTPPAFIFTGMIWRDVLFADVWLCAAALAFCGREASPLSRRLLQALGLALIGFGILLRPNAIIAAPILAVYVAWPDAFRVKRAMLLLLPGIIAGYALIQIVYYPLLGATRQNPLHSVFVFDLGGITYFSGENRFPVAFPPEQAAMLLTRHCYNPTRWDFYWHIPPCDFVMKRLERPDDVVFGTPRLVAAWRDAVLAHPLAYLSHRATFMWTFLAEPFLVLPVFDLVHPERRAHTDNPWFMAMIALHDRLAPTILFRPGAWLALALAIVALAWRRRETAAGAFALGTAGSGAVYLLSFFAFGVSAEYRYAYWCVLACLAGAVALAAARRDALKPASDRGAAAPE